MKTTKANINAQEKILVAARELFTKQGYAAVKTRDIAAAAGINIALLNYYFRSKEQLFEQVMQENFGAFVKGVTEVINNPDNSLEEKIDLLVVTYMDMLEKNPNMPLFVLNHVSQNKSKIDIKEKMMSSVMMKQFHAGVGAGHYSHIHPSQFMLNLLGLVVFPFMARPMLLSGPESGDPNFLIQIMKQRRAYLPHWIKALIKVPLPDIPNQTNFNQEGLNTLRNSPTNS